MRELTAAPAAAFPAMARCGPHLAEISALKKEVSGSGRSVTCLEESGGFFRARGDGG